MLLACHPEGVPEAARPAGMRVAPRSEPIAGKLLVACTAALVSLPAFAQAGRLDSTFGSGGLFVSSGTSFPNAAAAAIESNGKIGVSGQFNGLPGVARLTSNGALDASFGKGGVATTNIDSSEIASAVGIGVQSTGKIVIGLSTLFGANADGFTLVRFNSNGTLDTSFGNGGSVSISPFNQSFVAPSVLAIEPNNDILLAGEGAAVRFTANGSLDTTFGTDGVAAIPFGTITAIALQPNGDILLGTGSQQLGPTPPQGAVSQGAVTRLLSDGAIDNSFGCDGLVATLPAAAAIAVESDGQIVVAGALARLGSQASGLPLQTGFGVVRLNSNGSIDTTFGADGTAFAEFPGFSGAVAYAMAIQSNGAIVVAGDTAVSNSFTTATDFALARFTATGVLDSTFGSGGTVTTSLGSTNEGFITSLAIQGNGGIVAAGVDASNSGQSGGAIAVVRYTGH